MARQVLRKDLIHCMRMFWLHSKLLISNKSRDQVLSDAWAERNLCTSSIIQNCASEAQCCPATVLAMHKATARTQKVQGRVMVTCHES